MSGALFKWDTAGVGAASRTFFREADSRRSPCVEINQRRGTSGPSSATWKFALASLMQSSAGSAQTAAKWMRRRGIFFGTSIEGKPWPLSASPRICAGLTLELRGPVARATTSQCGCGNTFDFFVFIRSTNRVAWKHRDGIPRLRERPRQDGGQGLHFLSPFRRSQWIILSSTKGFLLLFSSGSRRIWTALGTSFVLR